MRGHRQGIQSTQTMQQAIIQARRNVDNLQPDEEICATHDMFCFAALANLNTGTMYTNLLGAFPIHFFKSMQYIFMAYIYDLNAICVPAMPSKNNAAMITAFTKILATLAACSYKPTLNVTDNKCPWMVEVYIKSNKINIYFVPPHNHQVNTAKRTIATFKEHFIGCLATVNRNRPPQLWDEFLHQVDLTLNLLHFSYPDLSKSANKEVHRPYDFNKTPITPIGTKSLFYDNLTIRASWALHKTDAFYVGPAPKHYWCLRFYMPTTQRCRIADTWRLYPSHCTIPTILIADLMVLVACNMLRTLQNTFPMTAIKAANCSMAIRDLSAIINPTLPPSTIAPRVGAALEPREPPATITTLPDTRVLCPTVSNSPTPASLYPQNVTTSINATSRARICATQFVHQRVTHNNNPFASLANKEPDDPNNHAPTDCSSKNVTITASNQAPAHTQLPPQPITRGIALAPWPAPMRPPHSTVTPRILCSGHAIPVPPLIAPTQQYIQQSLPTAKPTRSPPLTPTTPPTMYPPTKPTAPFDTYPVPTYIKPDGDDHNDTPSQLTRSAIQLNFPNGLARISRQALYHVINLAFNSPPTYTIQQTLSRSPDCILHSIVIKEVCNRVAHPVTKETITKYTNLMNNPVLSPLWVPAMSKELHRLVQGKEGTTVGTNTIFFSPMAKSGAPPKTAPSPMCTLS
jgi:hypothetical protein